MPIFTSQKSFLGYKSPSLSPSLFRLLEDSLSQRYRSRVIMRLACYLEVTGQRLTLTDFRTGRGAAIIFSYLGALFSPRFHEVTQPWADAAALREALKSVISEFPKFPTTHNRKSWKAEFQEAVERFEAARLILERITFWQGWFSINLRGQRAFVQLAGVHERYGPKLTTDIFRAFDGWFRSSRSISIPAFNSFLQFLANRRQTVDFTSSRDVGQLFLDFFHAFFAQQLEVGTRLTSASNQWRDFRWIITNHLVDSVWATPLPVMPNPRAIAVSGCKTNTLTSADGSQIKCSLLTDIPLTVTDNEAKELLFSQIARDHDLVLKWARSEIHEARDLRHHTFELARRGTPMLREPSSGRRANYRKLSPAHPIDIELADVAATWLTHGLLRPPDVTSRLPFYPGRLQASLKAIGIPDSRLLIAYSTVESPRLL